MHGWRKKEREREKEREKEREREQLVNTASNQGPRSTTTTGRLSARLRGELGAEDVWLQSSETKRVSSLYTHLALRGASEAEGCPATIYHLGDPCCNRLGRPSNQWICVDLDPFFLCVTRSKKAPLHQSTHELSACFIRTQTGTWSQRLNQLRGALIAARQSRWEQGHNEGQESTKATRTLHLHNFCLCLHQGQGKDYTSLNLCPPEVTLF